MDDGAAARAELGASSSLTKALRTTPTKEIEGICDMHGIGPEDFDNPCLERYWLDRWECEDNPSAKAFWLLSRSISGPTGSARGPLLEFHEGDNHPGSNDRWVNAKDKLSLSLLQARLIDLRMPIKIVRAPSDAREASTKGNTTTVGSRLPRRCRQYGEFLSTRSR